MAAYNVGTHGIVIKPKGWASHFVRHELIHHLQNERLGIVRGAFLTPVWFREGMAYSMSLDPRRPIPAPIIEAWRARFESWMTNRASTAIDGEFWRDAARL
ncbi:MAG: hypothetical protein AAF737_09830 [Pseudomonadota bacterium]